MTNDVALQLRETGRSHALSSEILYSAALQDGETKSPKDPELFAFNGTYSLSIFLLMCLGLELLLKAAYVASGGPTEANELRKIGHDLVLALSKAEEFGFSSDAPRLREIVEHVSEPYKAHYFRYDRPDELEMPVFGQVIEALAFLDAEVAILGEMGDSTHSNSPLKTSHPAETPSAATSPPLRARPST